MKKILVWSQSGTVVKFFMRLFIAVLVLIFSFQSWTKADDIRDFQIEGMSVGNSLLDYMNDNMIITEMNNKDYSYFYNNDFVAISTWKIRDKFETYDDVGVTLKTNDKEYKIYALQGSLYMEKNSDIKECYKKQNEIVNDIKNSLNLNNQGRTWFVDKKSLYKHQLSVKYIDFELNEGVVRIACFEIKKGVKKFSDVNKLYVIINSSTFWNYLENY